MLAPDSVVVPAPVLVTPFPGPEMMLAIVRFPAPPTVRTSLFEPKFNVTGPPTRPVPVDVIRKLPSDGVLLSVLALIGSVPMSACTSSVAPSSIPVPAAVVPSAAAFLTTNVPEFTPAPPPNVLTPDKVRVPAPVLLKPDPAPVPAITVEIVKAEPPFTVMSSDFPAGVVIVPPEIVFVKPAVQLMFD